MLAAFLQFLLNVLLIGSMLAFVACGIYLSIAADNMQERYIRFGAFFSGGLVVLGSQAAGLDFAQFISNALSTADSAATGVGIVVSGAAGAGVGWFFVRCANDGDIFAIRIMIFVGMLAATQFAEVYVTTFHDHGFGLGPAVVPNVAFVVGILLCIALTYDPKHPRNGRKRLRQLRISQAPQNPLETNRQMGASPIRADPPRES